MPEQSSTDPFLWLEDVTGDAALDWVRDHNEPTVAELCDDTFEQMRAEALEILDTDSRIPYVRRRGEHLYNFWRDGANPRGLWRRTTLESYRTDQPEWDVLIDVDALAAVDDENWVWAGADVIEPDLTLALISLSRNSIRCATKGCSVPASSSSESCLGSLMGDRLSPPQEGPASGGGSGRWLTRRVFWAGNARRALRVRRG